MKSIYAYLREQAAAGPGRVLLADERRTITRTQALALAQGTAAELSALGVRPGELVALRCSRTAETALLFLTLECLGAVAVLTDPHQTAEGSLSAVGREVRAAWAITDESGAWTVTRRATGQTYPLTLTEGSVPLPDPDPAAPGAIIFTSGSTGAAKAVVLSQANLAADLVDTQPMGDYREGDVALGVIPMEHVFGLVLLVGVVVLGYSIFLVARTDIPTILQTIQERKITRMNGVPTLYLAMAARREGYDLSSLRCGFIGGGPCTAEQFFAIERALDMTLLPAYGMSECVGITCSSHRDPQALRASGVGRFYPTDRAGIFRPDGTPAETGEEGEIWVDGPTRMLGYYGGGGVDENGFVHTGDLGYVDSAGILHLTGRKKDIIIRSGVNLSARRIEDALLSVEGVLEAAVVGLPHRELGEAPAAAVRCAPGLTGADILAALGGRLHKNELPERVAVLEALPATASGKVDKQKLREMLTAEG